MKIIIIVWKKNIVYNEKKFKNLFLFIFKFLNNKSLNMKNKFFKIGI